MIQYVAFMEVLDTELLGEWCSYNPSRFFKSSIETDKTVLEKWLQNKISIYPDSKVNNEGIFGAKYIITTTIIAFDTEKSDNVEKFLEHFIPY